MKKEEALKKLKWFIDDQLYYLETFDGLNWEQTEEVDPRSVEELLEFIKEDIGMLPPYDKKRENEAWVSDCTLYDGHTVLCQWESEDEDTEES